MTTASAFVPEVSSQSLDLAKRVRRTISETTQDVCCEMFKQNLEAIVLTGSLSRDEGTIVGKDHGWVLLNDADFLLAFKTRTHRVAEPELRKAEGRIQVSLQARGYMAVVGLASVDSSYFGRLPAHSYTYELKHCADVIWGHPKVLDRIPSYSIAQLSKEDAWRTLCNRLIELLICDNLECIDAHSVGQEVAYATMKLCLDMATSYLIFAECYEPTYRGRERRVKALADDSERDDPFDLKQFSRLVSSCTEMKLSRLPLSRVDITTVHRVVANALKLWVWEAAKLAGDRTPTSIPDAVERLARKQTTFQRCRGWGSFLRRVNCVKEWRQWTRWARLSLESTPRYLIYEVAAELASRVPSSASAAWNCSLLDLTILRSRLPDISSFPLHTSCTAKMLISDIRRNYKNYLCETYA